MKSTFLIILALFVVSCAPKPDDACEQLIKIYADSSTKPAHLQTQDQCIKALNTYKDRWGVNGYRRYTECVLEASTQYKAQRCLTEEKRRAHS